MSADAAQKDDSVPAGAVDVCDRTDQRLDRLHRIIDEKSLLRGDFQLSSGRRSNYLFQLRQTAMHPEGASLIGDVVVDFMREHDLRCVGGLELGAVPIVSAISIMSFQKGFPVSAFFVRKEAKQHGAKERIDGDILPGSDVLIVDDVTTTGGSSHVAVEQVLKKGCTVSKALSIVDREEGATEFLAGKGITLYSLFKRRDFNIG